MHERPILFSGPMVRAILDGRKTQTRRVVTPQPRSHAWRMCTRCRTDADYCKCAFASDEAADRSTHVIAAGPPQMSGCPYGGVGDRLWVRETWGEIVWSIIYGNPRPPRSEIVYRAGPHPFDRDTPHGWSKENRWKPSIHMPRSASRLTLEVTGVRVERLQDISGEDCAREGITIPPSDCFSDVNTNWKLRRQYENLWDSLNAKRAPWSSNPWVWVIEFKRMDAETGANNG